MNLGYRTSFFSEVEIDASLELASAIDPSVILNDSSNPEPVEYEEYNEERHPHSLHNRRFVKCSFDGISYSGKDAHNIMLKECRIAKCHIINSNFKSADFTESAMQFIGYASSFDSSDFTNARLFQIRLRGCSLSESMFHHTLLSKCQFQQSEFVGSRFVHSTLREIDLTSSNLDYAEFVHTNWYDAVLPYWGTLHIVRGLPDILSGKNICFSTLDGRHSVNADQYIEETLLLRPFLYKQRDYLALANLYIFEGENGKAYDAIIHGLKDACSRGHLNMIRHLCRLASLNSFFTKSQLRDFYNQIESLLYGAKLSVMQYKNYWQELDIAKRLLIDSPYDQDEIEITIETTIPSSDYSRLSVLLKSIDKIFETSAPDAVSHTEIRHNSPITITIVSSGIIAQLILAFIIIDRVFDKSSTYVERLQNIILNHKKIRATEFEQSKIEALEKQIAEMQKTIEKLDMKKGIDQISPLILPGTEEFSRISYKLSTRNPAFDDLRTYSRTKVH